MFLNEEFLKVYEELSELNKGKTNTFKPSKNKLVENLIRDNGKLKWSSSPEGLDTTHTTCEQCGRVISSGTLPLEKNRPVQCGFYSYLYNVLGKNLCYDCIQKTDAGNLENFFRTIESRQSAIDYFNAGDFSNFKYYSGDYYDDAWAKCKDQLENLTAEEKKAIDAVLDKHTALLNSKEYKSYLADLEALYQARREEETRKASLRAPKTSIKRNSYIYMALQDFDDGSFNIICVDKNLAVVKNQFKESIFDFIVDGVDADAKMFLFKINIAAIQDTRLLDLFKEYLGDDYPVETSKEHQELLYEYRQDFWKGGWCRSLLECYDNEAIEECYSQELDPEELINNGEWEDFVKNYIEETYANI